MLFSAAKRRSLAYLSSTLLMILSATPGRVDAGYPSTTSLAQYWGQNSGLTQKPMASYCDGVTDALIVSFISAFNLGGLPVLNLANACTDDFFEGTQLLHCPSVAKDIKTCQSKGAKIILSLGGASGAYGFQNDGQAVTFANTLWNLFGNGKSDTRPFDDAVVDGFDLDIEGGGATGYVALVKELRRLFATDTSKSYYMTAAPQCPFPDAMLGSTISAIGFDAIHVQFYNNYCSPTSNSFNFDTWDQWAKTESPNKDVKIFFTIPGSPSAAGSGYVPFSALSPIVKKVASSYSSYGGIAVWDASQSYGNTEVSPNYAVALGSLVHGGSPGSPAPEPTSSAPSLPSSSSLPSASQSSPASGTHSSVSTSIGGGPSSLPSSSPSATSSSSSAPSPISEATCPKSGDTCGTEGRMLCTGSSYAVCNHGKYVVVACPASTSCFGTTDGQSIYCGFPGPGSSNTCPDPNKLSASSGSGHPVPKPYQSNKVSAQLSVSNTTHDAFEAIINARRMDSMPFGPSVVVQFNVHPNTKVTSATGGLVKQDGSVVKIQVKNDKKKSMSLVFGIKGTLDSGVFIAPEVTSMKFMS